MKEIARSAIVEHSAAQMYALVDDIESYPRFLPWCREARVVDDAGNEIPPGVAGEVIVRGPNVFFEYWGNAEATAETLRQIDEELRKDVSLSRAADLAEQAARIMLADLDEWRLVNQQRDLSVG